MPAVAEVQFKAVNSQQVVTAFNSVGNAAQQGTTKINQNSNAMKTMGQGMKGSISGIGQVTTAFATLSLSIVSTWRAYRDLGDAQIAVDKANLRVQKTTEAIRKTEAEVAKLKKENAKGGAASVAATNKIRLAEEKLYKARKDGKHTAAEIAVMEDELNKLKSGGTESSKKLEDAENKLALQKEQLGVQTDVAAEAQERFNDIQQDFYLSILPLGISSIATLTSAFKGLGGVLKGGGGLLGGLGPIGLILTGITAAIIAFKTNFLGLRDAVGGVIDWIKARFGLWKDTIEKVFNLIKGGKWAEAFNFIKEAAAKFWEDLKKSVPLFAEVDKLVQNIRNGNWKAAFLQIWKAATDAWATIKKNIPILGKVEDAVRAISEGKWGEAFQKIADTALEVFNSTLGKGIEWIFGKNWKAGFDAKIAEITAEASINNRSIPVQVGIEINTWIKDVTGIDVAKWFKDHPITTGVLPLGLGGISLAIDDPEFRGAIAKGSLIIINALGEALTRVAKLLDPYLSKVITALSWDNLVLAVNEVGAKIKLAGESIWQFIFGGIEAGYKGQDWTKLFTDLPTIVNDAWAKNLPETQKAIIANWQQSPMAKGLAGLGIKFNATPVPDPNTPKIIQNGIKSGEPYKVPTEADNTKMKNTLKTDLNKVMRGHYPIPFTADMSEADKKWKAFVKKVQMTTLQVKIAGTSVNMRRGSQAGAYGGPGHQHGYQGTVKRPTMFLAGEGGRPEDVTVRPRGSVQRGGTGGGSGPTIINVYVDGVLQRARYTINENQGVFK